MSEIPSPTPEPEKPKVKDRINSVLLTLRANPIFVLEAYIPTTQVITPIAEPMLQKRLNQAKGNPNKELPDQTFFDVFQEDIMPGATISVLTLFGRPLAQTVSEMQKAGKLTRKHFNARNFSSSIYQNSLIPHLMAAWRTGKIQIADTGLSSERTIRQTFKDGAKQIYRRLFPPKSK